MAIYDQRNNHHHHHQQQQQQPKQRIEQEQLKTKQQHHRHRRCYNSDQKNLIQNYMDDHYSENIKEQIMKSKSVLKKRRKTFNVYGVICNNNVQYCLLVVFCFLLPKFIECQFQYPHDPRFYSREGDHNYHWPNPGDPEYR